MCNRCNMPECNTMQSTEDSLDLYRHDAGCEDMSARYLDPRGGTGGGRVGPECKCRVIPPSNLCQIKRLVPCDSPDHMNHGCVLCHWEDVE
jgi:hypothetical protein